MPIFPIALQQPIKIEALRITGDRLESSVAYEGDVVVRYGPTTLMADRVVAYRNEARGVAEGRVTIIDPDGTARADRVEFSWDPAHRYARAENLVVRVQGGFIKARRADLQPGQWTLLDVEGTTSAQRVYYVTSEKLIYTPGKDVVVREPRVSVFGKFIAELPNQRVATTPVVPGLRLPVPGYKLGRGFGATWSGGVLAGHDSTFVFDARAFQKTKPSASAYYTKSFLPVSKATEVVAPRTDFAERFYYGYMDSVLVDAPAAEARFLRANRSSLSGGGQANGSVVDRDRGTRYSKVEAVIEQGGSVAGIGILGQLRAQGLQRETEGMEARATATASISLPTVTLAPRLSTIGRVDSAAFGGRTAYGWARGMLGLSYAPATWLRLSAAGFTSGEAGTPQFDIDPLYSKGGTLLRADLAIGGFRASYLSKNDRRRGNYDNEYAINQIVGGLEVYYVHRDYPGRSQIGLTIHLQPLIDLVKRRTGQDVPVGKRGPPEKTL